MSAEQRAAVGDLVLDHGRDGCEAVVTDIEQGVPILRHRHGAMNATWSAASVLQLEIVARRGEWSAP